MLIDKYSIQHNWCDQTLISQFLVQLENVPLNHILFVRMHYLALLTHPSNTLRLFEIQNPLLIQCAAWCLLKCLVSLFLRLIGFLNFISWFKKDGQCFHYVILFLFEQLSQTLPCVRSETEGNVVLQNLVLLFLV